MCPSIRVFVSSRLPLPPSLSLSLTVLHLHNFRFLIPHSSLPLPKTMHADSAADHGDPSTLDSTPPPQELGFRGFSSDLRCSSIAGGTGVMAKYKLMPPARLPISRSPRAIITITSPGFSPGALLESPVLLTNIKVKKQR